MPEPKEPKLEPKDKLDRARRSMKWTLDQCDAFVGEKNGREYNNRMWSYVRGRAKPQAEYLKPLAEAWGIPVEWFFDGVDDMPPIGKQAGASTVYDASPAQTQVQFRGDLPGRAGRRMVASEVQFSAAFPIPPDAAAWRQGDNELQPLIRKGDLLLVFMDDVPRRGTLAVVETADGRVDLYNIVREADGESARPIRDDQPGPGDNWTQLGYLTALRRTVEGGLTISFECESGLAPDMLTI